MRVQAGSAAIAEAPGQAMTRRHNARGRNSPDRMPKDWTSLALETPVETICRVMDLGADDLETINVVREVMAQEITKLVYRYTTQGRLINSSVVGFQLEDLVTRIRESPIRWRVTWVEDGKIKEAQFPVEAAEEMDNYIATTLAHVEEVHRCLM